MQGVGASSRAAQPQVYRFELKGDRKARSGHPSAHSARTSPAHLQAQSCTPIFRASLAVGGKLAPGLAGHRSGAHERQAGESRCRASEFEPAPAAEFRPEEGPEESFYEDAWDCLRLQMGDLGVEGGERMHNYQYLHEAMDGKPAVHGA